MSKRRSLSSLSSQSTLPFDSHLIEIEEYSSSFEKGHREIVHIILVGGLCSQGIYWPFFFFFWSGAKHFETIIISHEGKTTIVFYNFCTDLKEKTL